MRSRTIAISFVITTHAAMAYVATAQSSTFTPPRAIRESKPPVVLVLAPSDPSTGTFAVTVEAWNPAGIASVTVSLDGVSVGTRLRPPYTFNVVDAQLPAEVCALATDQAGNSALHCLVVGHQGTCQESTECTDATQYCSKAWGSCSGAGICKVRRENCRPSPVCGCDGTTYATECEAASAGVSMLHDGICEGDACRENSECRHGQFCMKLAGFCGSRGFCYARSGRDTNCNPFPTRPPEYACGCNGKTYMNTCDAARFGVNVSHEGPCTADR